MTTRDRSLMLLSVSTPPVPAERRVTLSRTSSNVAADPCRHRAIARDSEPFPPRDYKQGLQTIFDRLGHAVNTKAEDGARSLQRAKRFTAATIGPVSSRLRASDRAPTMRGTPPTPYDSDTTSTPAPTSPRGHIPIATAKR